MGTICANSEGYFYKARYLLCCGASFDPFFEVCQRTAVVTALGPQRYKVVGQRLDEPNAFVVIKEL